MSRTFKLLRAAGDPVSSALITSELRTTRYPVLRDFYDEGVITDDPPHRVVIATEWLPPADAATNWHVYHTVLCLDCDASAGSYNVRLFGDEALARAVKQAQRIKWPTDAEHVL